LFAGRAVDSFIKSTARRQLSEDMNGRERVVASTRAIVCGTQQLRNRGAQIANPV
jgi:hypothetical protein